MNINNAQTYTGRKYCILWEQSHSATSGKWSYKKRKKNKLDELTLADRFSSVTPTENGEDGLVTY